MKLVAELMKEWPKLAWVATMDASAGEARVLHGPGVESSADWIVEAIWAGEFEDGDFDQTDLVFGTGIRKRGEHLAFVSSGTTFDRLWYTTSDGNNVVSNTLPGLLSVAGLRLKSDYLEYSHDVRSITRGPEDAIKTIPTDTVDVTAVYYNNLLFKEGQLVEVEKPNVAPSFDGYCTYNEFLVSTAEALGRNLRNERRVHSVSQLSSISSGYDSSAAAVAARHAGCQHTVTIRDSTSYWRGSDSGAPVAEALGMTCTEYSRTASDYPHENAFWAGTGWPGILNWSLFDYGEDLCLFFTGCHGEKMWDRVQHDHPDPFVRRDVSSLGFCEYRLIRGVWQCVVPFWGVRNSHQMRSIATSEEMHPWVIGKDYDKPVARRLAEEAGVPRESFGMLKKNSVLAASFLCPYSSDAAESFRDYLNDHNIYAPSDFVIALARTATLVDNLLYRNTLKKLGLPMGPRPWHRISAPSLLFQWGNESLAKTHYSLQGRDVGISATSMTVSTK